MLWCAEADAAHRSVRALPERNAPPDFRDDRVAAKALVGARRRSSALAVESQSGEHAVRTAREDACSDQSASGRRPRVCDGPAARRLQGGRRRDARAVLDLGVVDRALHARPRRAHTRGRRRLLRDRGDDEVLRRRHVDRRAAPGGTAHDFENRTAERAGALKLSVPGDFEPHMGGSPSGSARAQPPRPARRTRHAANRSVQAAAPLELEGEGAIEHSQVTSTSACSLPPSRAGGTKRPCSGTGCARALRGRAPGAGRTSRRRRRTPRRALPS